MSAHAATLPARHSRAALAGLVVLALALPGCAGRKEVDDAVPSRVSTSLVEIENQHWSDVVVYAESGGTRARMGTVTSMSGQTFRLPIGLGSGQVRVVFVLDPIGTIEVHRMEAVSVAPGQRIRLRLLPELAQSSVSVY